MEHEFFRPSIPIPYPGEFEAIYDFKYKSRLMLARLPERVIRDGDRETHYIVAEPFEVAFKVDGVERDLTVPKGLLTDLVSVPRFGRILVERVGPHLEAAIVHDFLYVAWQLLDGRDARPDDKRFADEVMFAGLKATRMPKFQQFAIRVALRAPFVSWSVYKGRNKRIFIRFDDRLARATGDGLATA